MFPLGLPAGYYVLDEMHDSDNLSYIYSYLDYTRKTLVQVEPNIHISKTTLLLQLGVSR